MFGLTKEKEEEKLKKLKEYKSELEYEITRMQQKIEELEEKMGLGTPRFVQAKVEDERELEEYYDTIEIYEEQLADTNKMIEKLDKKLNKKNKR